MFLHLSEDREWIENKYHKQNEPFDPYQRMAYHGQEFDAATGLSDTEICAGLRTLAQETAGLSHPVAKARAVEYVLEHTRIEVSPHDYFVGIWSLNRLLRETTVKKWKTEVFREKLPEVAAEMEALNASGAVGIWPDFDHVVPDWNAILTLGFPGLRERARAYRRRREAAGALDAAERAFFDAIEIEYTAIIAFLDRLYHLALTRTHEKAALCAECLCHLRDGAPTDSYEAMQLMFLYFLISESIDHYQVRSLGNGLDASLYPFYRRDLDSGRFTREELREFLAYFLLQWSAIGNYWGQPFYLGGTGAGGESLVNDLSYDILEVYGELDIYNPKIQIKYNENLPRRFLDKVLDLIRGGKSCFVFCCEPGMWRAMMRYGVTAEEARTMDIRGCYETGVRANEVSAATGYVNPLKAVSFVFTDGFDPATGRQIGIRTGDMATFADFGDFYAAFLRQYGHLIDRTIALANAYDPYMDYINPSSLYSATVEQSLVHARDGYGGGVKYNNSSVLNCGLGTAVDAVLAVRYLVFEKKAVTLMELAKALECNWQGYEALRQAALNCPWKYGNGDPVADAYAAGISAFFCDRVNGRKNGRGGVYKATLHSAMQFVWQGEKIAATPDGRRAGEEISKNASPTPGMDKKGVTALISSATALTPSAYSESFCLDVLLSPTATEGEEGLLAIRALLDVYMRRGGMSIQFNVFRADTLRDAQAHPERYRNLQVRVCGWNVLWNNLSHAEQDAYIRRAEALQE